MNTRTGLAPSSLPVHLMETGMICGVEMYRSISCDLNQRIFDKLDIFAPTHAPKIAVVNEKIIR